jgi:preprotein translocase subunit SecE
MGVETKKMANSLAAADNFGDRIKSWPERVKTFYNDVRTEMKKVTAPSFKEVRATTAVVIVTVFLFAAYFWVVDLVIGHGIDSVFRYFGHR